MDKRLKDLHRIADMMFQAKLAELRKVTLAEAALKEQLDALAAQKARNHGQGLDEPAMVAGAYQRWEAWVGRQRQMLNRERAGARVELELCNKAAAQALGQVQAINELCKRAATRRS